MQNHVIKDSWNCTQLVSLDSHIDCWPVEIFVPIICFDHFIFVEKRIIFVEELSIFLVQQISHASAIERQDWSHVSAIQFQEWFEKDSWPWLGRYQL